MACPVGTEYPLGKPGTEKIDKALIGSWISTRDDADVKRVTIKKVDKYSYDVRVTERGAMYLIDSDIFIGYVTKLDGHKFVYFKDVSDGSYYLYHYEIKGKEMITHDVGLLVGGMDAVTSTESYCAEVSASLKIDTCLTEKTVWRKE